jgi:hypothetical protein
MIFRKNGCSNRDIKCAFFLRWRPQSQEEKLTVTVVLQFQQTVSYKISRLLAKHNIKTIHVLWRKPFRCWDW